MFNPLTGLVSKGGPGSGPHPGNGHKSSGGRINLKGTNVSIRSSNGRHHVYAGEKRISSHSSKSEALDDARQYAYGGDAPMSNTYKVMKGGPGGGAYPRGQATNAGSTQFGGYEIAHKDGQHHVLKDGSILSSHMTRGDAVQAVKENIKSDRKQKALANMKSADEADNMAFGLLGGKNKAGIDNRPFVSKAFDPILGIFKGGPGSGPHPGSGKKKDVLRDIKDMRNSGHSDSEIKYHLAQHHGLNEAQQNFAIHAFDHPEIRDK